MSDRVIKIFDTTLRDGEQSPGASMNIAEKLEIAQVLADLGFHVARVDGRIAAAERKQIRLFLERRYGQTPEVAKQLSHLLEQAEKKPVGLLQLLDQLKKVLPAENWAEAYRFAESVADSSGGRNAKEKDCLERLGQSLGIQAALPTAAATPAPSVPPSKSLPKTTAECRAALEIPDMATLSVELIRRQYRLLGERFEPAKFLVYGLNFYALAESRAQAIEHAARELLKPYNEPLDLPTAAPPSTDSRHNPDLDEAFGM